VADPIAKDFSAELSAYRTRQIAQAADLLKAVEPFRESEKSAWAERMSPTLWGALATALLATDSKTEATALLMKFVGNLEGEPKQTLQNLVEELVPKLPDDSSDAAREVTTLAVYFSSRAGGGQDVPMFQLWAAFELADELAQRKVSLEVARRSVATRAVNAVPVTALAVLMDQPTRVVLRTQEQGRYSLEFAGAMKYRYATSRLEEKSGDTLQGARDSEGNLEAVEIEGLTRVANLGLPALERAYEPLRAVAEYARIKAFLAWARSNVGRVDLSNCA
jgi:hypothetical protein